MRIALGVHVSTYEVTASLVDTTLPALGPMASRTVNVADAPGGIGGALSTAIGFMRVQALQNGLAVDGVAVVCENAVQRELVVAALAEADLEPMPVVDIFDERLPDAYTPDVGAAMLVGELEPSVAAQSSVAAGGLRNRGGDQRRGGEHHRGMWPVAAVGACVLAALGGVTAWAMTSQPGNAADVTAPAEVVYPTGAPGASTIPSTRSESAASSPPVDPAPPGPDALPGLSSTGPQQVVAPAQPVPAPGGGTATPESPDEQQPTTQPPAPTNTQPSPGEDPDPSPGDDGDPDTGGDTGGDDTGGDDTGGDDTTGDDTTGDDTTGDDTTGDDTGGDDTGGDGGTTGGGSEETTTPVEPAPEQPAGGGGDQAVAFRHAGSPLAKTWPLAV